MRKIIIILLCVPVLSTAQPLQFELESEAFPAEINGWQMYSPWAGGMDRTSPELCDLDSDGDYDFFTGSEINKYWYFENIGNSASPSFKYVSSYFDSLYPICEGTSRSCIRFCDINGDGLKDVFISNGIPGVIINQGTANQWDFSGPIDTLRDQFNMDVWGTYMDLVDIDSDDDYDLFTGFWDSQVHSIRFYENFGTYQDYDFHYITQNWQNIQTTGGYESPCFSDLDGDGDLDLLVGTGQGKIYYYRNDGTPQVPQMTYITNNFCDIDVGEDASPELKDIDDDGDLDLLVGRDSGIITSLLTQGDVYYYENVGTPQNYSFQFVTTNYLTFDNGKEDTPRLVDIDADGAPDLFTRVNSHILLYSNQGTIGNPAFVYETDNFCELYVNNIKPWFCDIDDDGDLDLFAGTSAIPGPPGLHLFMNRGTPQNPNYVLYSDNVVPGVFNQGSVTIVPGTADIDADGDLDLFVTDDWGYFYYWENIGSPTNFIFQYQTNNWQNIYDGIIDHRYFHFYDIDHDNDLDLFYSGLDANNIKTLRFYRNIGTAQAAIMVLEENDLFPDLTIWRAAPYVIDIDEDEDGDLFLGDYWGGIRFFRNLEMENLARIDSLTIAFSGNDVILTWPAVSIAEEYKIYYQDSPYFTPTGIPQAVVLPPETVWSDINAVLEGQKYYRVVVEY